MPPLRLVKRSYPAPRLRQPSLTDPQASRRSSPSMANILLSQTSFTRHHHYIVVSMTRGCRQRKRRNSRRARGRRLLFFRLWNEQQNHVRPSLQIIFPPLATPKAATMASRRPLSLLPIPSTSTMTSPSGLQVDPVSTVHVPTPPESSTKPMTKPKHRIIFNRRRPCVDGQVNTRAGKLTKTPPEYFSPFIACYVAEVYLGSPGCTHNMDSNYPST